MIEISVVIPTCDRPVSLLEAINCVLDQSYPAREIIIVNNGSQPIDALRLPPQVKVNELQPFVGASRARNYGATLAAGEYVAFLDDDDLWELDYLDKVAGEIEEHHPDCIITRLDKMVDGRIYPYKNADGKVDLATLFVSNPGIGGQTTIVRHDVFLQIGGYDIKLETGEDKALIIELLINGYSVATAPHIQAILREHDSSRLTDAESMHEGISGFVDKYGRRMSSPQKNFNLVKVYYYRYLAKHHTIDYFHYWFRYLLNLIYCKINSTLSDAPVLPLLSPLKKQNKAIRHRMEDNDS
jgi:glycosyltransferase involved in cell wall biosynthesis